jgi:kinesin family protein 4/21/27
MNEDATAELKREIAMYEKLQSASTTYIASLEQRLARADTDIVTPRSQVKKLESDLESRDAAMVKLQAVCRHEGEDLCQWKDG